MTENNVRVATVEDLRPIALNLRDADKDEIYASSGKRLYLASMKESFEMSEICYTWTINDKPTMMLGVCEGGIVWALGTDDMLTERAFFLKESVKYIEEFLCGYDRIFNYVYCNNTVHINWLKRAGFTFAEEPIILKNGEKFIYFSKENENV